MKDGLENIDELFKQTFDGFESNVDPSVWSNVQSSIGSGSGGSSTPQVDPSVVTSIAGKSLAVKIVAGVALLGAVATSVYFIPDLFKDKENVVVENVTTDEETPIDVIEENEAVIAEETSNDQVTNSIVDVGNTEESNSVITVETNVLESEANISINDEQVNSNVEASTEAKSEATTKQELSTTKTNNSVKKNSPVKVDEPVDFSVKLNADVIKGKAPLTVQFDAYGEGVEQYFWNFSDDSDEEVEESPIHIFQSEGTYSVSLTGLDKYGNTKKVTQVIIVEKDYSSLIHTPIQNQISPNGDGENDILKVRGKNIEKISVRIADSKGNPVYFMKSLDEVWNGKDQNGNALNQGQYYMTIVAIGKDGKKHTERTVINLWD